MDDTDRKVRRRLLRPLRRNPKRNTAVRSFRQAVQQIDERAFGEELLAQMRRYLSPTRHSRRSGPRDDPDRAMEMVALAQALYASRRISRSEYAFYAAAPVEGVHDSRWMAGQYSELEPIYQAMKQIEADNGLEADEYWQRGQWPKEYGKLSQQYTAVLDAKFRDTLAEFHLDDLVTLFDTSPKEFHHLRERGRRSVFHKSEYVPALRDVVVQYEKEARIAASAGAYSTAITALGAAVEGLLILRCLNSPRKAARICKRLPKRDRTGKPDDPTTWTFKTLIEVCVAAHWLKPIETSGGQYNTAVLAHILRDMRNYVHPAKRARERPWLTTDKREYEDAEAIFVVLRATVGNIRPIQMQDQEG